MIDPAASLLGLLFLLLGSCFSTMHLCLMELSRSELEEISQARSGWVKKRTAAILKDVAGHARAAALSRIVCNLAVAVCCVWVARGLRGADGPDLLDGVIGVAASALVLWLFSATFADSIARHAPERFVLTFGPLVRATYLVQTPLAPVARWVDSLVRHMSGVGKISKQAEIADELLEVVEEGEREGAIDENERRMIESVVAFKHLTVEQIMTPRGEIEALELTSNLGAITAFVRRARHSRVPVYKAGGTLDDIVGFFYVKDLLRWLSGDVSAGGVSQRGVGAGVGAGVGGGAGGGFDLRHIIRPAFFVPETKTVRQLLDELVEKKVHAAIVADEYGGVAGIVTIEDIIEEVFGDIQDEYEKAEDDPPRIEVREEDHLADIEARAYIDDVNEALKALEVEIPEDDEYDTLGGFVMSHLGRMPEVNESFQFGRALVTVLETTPTRVVKVRVQVRDVEGEGRASEGEASKQAAGLDRGAK